MKLYLLQELLLLVLLLSCSDMNLPHIPFINLVSKRKNNGSASSIINKQSFKLNIHIIPIRANRKIS